MDGLELNRRLKSDPKTGDITVVALTVYAMKGDEAKAFASGAAATSRSPWTHVTSLSKSNSF